ncbi:MAG TPA: DNA methyltransferase [Caldilineaceae bacterium]|nr:DNA methyltransferase [Caldilineaceae bacterium]
MYTTARFLSDEDEPLAWHTGSHAKYHRDLPRPDGPIPMPASAPSRSQQPTSTAGRNRLYYGDNLPILREHIADASVDLIYLDPPFNSNRNYNVLFKNERGQAAEAQVQAFTDTWHWGPTAEASFHELVTNGSPSVSSVMAALRQFLGENQMMAYLTMMAARLVELHRVLKQTGSLYLHCDPTASHYLKLILDTIFGPENYRNEITWQRTNVHSDSKTWSHVSDTIFFYTKSSRFTWNPLYLPHDPSYIEDKYRYREADGRRYTLDNMTSPNPRPNMMYEWKGHASPPNGWRYSRETMQQLDAQGRIWYPNDKEKRPRLKRYLDEMPGRLISNVWTDISPLNSQAAERLGYPTQKPVALLERIIAASSHEGDVVLDPFCGCGTAIAAAQKLNRRWIGIDITHLAIALQKYRLKDTFDLATPKDYDVIGEPADLASVRQLAQENRYQFQWWAASRVQAKPYGSGEDDKKGKKGADRGIDAIINFFDDATFRSKRIIVQVKSGHVSVRDIRDLRGVLEREQAPMGLFITLEPPSAPMIAEAASAGFYLSPGWGRTFPRLQILTVEDLLKGQKPDIPNNVSFAQVPRERLTTQQYQKPLLEVDVESGSAGRKGGAGIQ